MLSTSVRGRSSLDVMLVELVHLFTDIGIDIYDLYRLIY